MPKRRYRVVFRTAKGERYSRTVFADSESDALLAAKQMLRAEGIVKTFPTSQATRTED